MKYIKLLLLPALFFAEKPVIAQTMTIMENTDQQVNASSGKGIVDINSNLTMSIQKNKLTETLAGSLGYDSKVRTRLNAINAILESQKAILTLLDPKIAGSTGNKSQEKEYYQLMENFLIRVMEDSLLRAKVNHLFEVYKDSSVDKSVYRYRQTYVMAQLPAVLEGLVAEVQRSERMGTLNIQLVATLSTKGESARKVHVQNFDTYSEGVYYEVPRWVTSFSEEDIEKFNRTAQLTVELNALINREYSAVKRILAQQLVSVDCFIELERDLQQLIRDRQTVFANEAGMVNDYLDKIRQQIVKLDESVKKLQGLTGNPNENALQLFNNVSSDFLALATEVPATVRGLATTLPPTLAANTQLRNFQGKMAVCFDKLRADSIMVSNMYFAVKDFLTNFKKSSDVTGEIGGDALSFTLDQLPAKGFIDLKTIGKRANGDELTLRICYKTRDDIAAKRPGIVIEQYNIQLQQVRFYSVANIAAIAAIPIGKSKERAIGEKIQFAPSGSLLVKFGSRKYRLWNDINPGFGINISTPDFDLDGAPDISYGGVFTLFRDVLSFGMSYNTKTSSPFCFFGASLPFASLGLVGKVETK